MNVSEAVGWEMKDESPTFTKAKQMFKMLDLSSPVMINVSQSEDVMQGFKSQLDKK